MCFDSIDKGIKPSNRGRNRGALIGEKGRRVRMRTFGITIDSWILNLTFRTTRRTEAATMRKPSATLSTPLRSEFSKALRGQRSFLRLPQYRDSSSLCLISDLTRKRAHDEYSLKEARAHLHRSIASRRIGQMGSRLCSRHFQTGQTSFIKKPMTSRRFSLF